MRGARGWATLGGAALIAVGIWQAVLLSGMGAFRDGSSLGALRYIASELMLGKSWGARIATLMLAIAPLRYLSERAETGWGSASRAFLSAWVPLAFVAALTQTASVERMRDLFQKGSTDATLTAITESHYVMWHALVEPLTMTAMVLGVFGFGFLVASLGKKQMFGGLAGIVALFAMGMIPGAVWAEPVILAIEGAALIFVAYGSKRAALLSK